MRRTMAASAVLMRRSPRTASPEAWNDNRMVFLRVEAPRLIEIEHGSDKDEDPARFHVTVTFDAQSDGKTVVTPTPPDQGAARFEDRLRRCGARLSDPGQAGASSRRDLTSAIAIDAAREDRKSVV